MSFCQVDISVFNALCIALIQMKFSTNREACLTESICKADIRSRFATCGKADIRNPLRYLLMNAVASRPAFKYAFIQIRQLLPD